MVKNGNFAKNILRLLLLILIVITSTLIVIGIIFSIYIEKNIEKSIDETLFDPIGTGSTTKLYYYDFSDRVNRIGILNEISDKELYSVYKCKSIKYEELPEDLINAFVSIEDKRYFEHNGVDWKRTVLAGANYFLKFNKNFGGSTITQQLIKNVTDNDDYSFQRKIQEIFWALDLENKMDKKEILTMYLNIINLSQGCFGVGAGAEFYFSKDVSELTLAECATIAAITNSPSYYDPIKNPSNNKYRRDIILGEMYSQGYIDQAQYQNAINTPIELNVSSTIGYQNINSWYVDMVIEDVINDLVEQKGYSRDIANMMIYTGGLRIYTAMDADIQKKLEDYYLNTNNFYSDSNSDPAQSATIVIDPNTGDILGVVGSIGSKNANRLQNFATQTLRPAGSVIKPLSVYAPALEKGIINWSTVYDDIPIKYSNLGTSKVSMWPKNANGTYRGLTNIDYAITHSINTISVGVLDELGIENSFDFLYNSLNIKSIIPYKKLENGSVITDKDYAALALGQFNYGVTLRETTAAYSIFSTQGIYNEYRSYFKVTDYKGNVLLSKPYNGKTVISEDNSAIMTKMLQKVITEGTAGDMRINSNIDVAGKTGTTQNNFDKWFIGYTPYYICGTWLGYEYPKSLSDYNGTSCNQIWADIINILHKDIDLSQETKKFSTGRNVVKSTFCVDSGKLSTEACRSDLRGDRTRSGYFVKGSEPSRYCTLHVLVPYDSQTQRVACSNCPEENIINVGMINIKRTLPTQVYITDAQYVWRDIGCDVLPQTSDTLPFFANILKDGQFSGISRAEFQKNAYCREHFDYFKWQEEKETGLD